MEKNSVLPEAAAFKEFYDAKKAGNGGILAIYKGAVPEDVKQQFFKQSDAHWQNIAVFITEELPAVLPESGFLGGETPGEDDFHFGAWLARVTWVCGGDKEEEGYKALVKELKGDVDPKIVAYWKAWSARPSWKKVYAETLH